MSGPEHPEQTVTVRVVIVEPDLVGAAFEMVHAIAKAHDLEDVEDVYIDMKVTLSGSPASNRLEAFKAQTNRLWMAGVTGVEPRHEGRSEP